MRCRPKATWIRDRVVEFDSSHDQVVLSDGSRLGYDYLVVAVGIKCAGTPSRA
jgi:NADH dehydrogenase FAD-containing subunit